MEIIQHVVQDALAGQGQVLSIRGEAGVGKSRLVSELIRRWLMSGGVGYGGDCLSYCRIPEIMRLCKAETADFTGISETASQR